MDNYYLTGIEMSDTHVTEFWQAKTTPQSKDQPEDPEEPELPAKKPGVRQGALKKPASHAFQAAMEKKAKAKAAATGKPAKDAKGSGGKNAKGSGGKDEEAHAKKAKAKATSK